MKRLPLPLLLALFTAIPPLAIDMYLPAMALMANDLTTDIHKVELSVSAFLIGFAVGQIAGGPLSDRIGRRPVILFGIALFSVTSVFLMNVQDLNQLLLLRVLQAIGGGMASVNSAAIVRDRYQGKDVAKTLSLVAMIMMLAPLVAPLLGSLVVRFGQWRDIFTLLSAYAFVVLVILSWQLEESHPPEKRQKSSPWGNYLSIIRHPVARYYVLALAFAFTTMFVFITASSYLYLEHFGQSSDAFPWLFGANIVVMMTMNRLNMILLRRFSSPQLLFAGILLQLGATLALTLLFASGQPNLATTVTLIAFSVGSIGLVAANAISLVLHYFHHISGSATALIGVSEFCLGALFGYLWSLLHNHTPLPMMLMMAVSACLALLCVLLARQVQHSDKVA